MTNKTSLGDRMKAYESASESKLINRAPVIIRVDGKNFSKLSKTLKLNKPFDEDFRDTMNIVMTRVCENIQDCVMGYGQSDEISFVLRNDQSLDSQPYFGNRVQKIASVSAGMASAYFTRALAGSVGVFDARVFNLPDLVEVENYLIWRQRDCVRNSILNTAYYKIAEKYGKKTSQKMMHGLNTSQLQELLFREVDVNWNDSCESDKRGVVAFRELYNITTENGDAIRSRWTAKPALIFTSEEGRKWLRRILTKDDSTDEIDEEKNEKG